MVITQEQAQQLIRSVCWLLVLIAGIVLIFMGCRRIFRPYGRHLRHRVPILYFLKANNRLYPVVNLGDAHAPRPVTVRTGDFSWPYKPGDLLDVVCHPKKSDHVFADNPLHTRLRGGILVMVGVIVAYLSGALLLAALRTVFHF